MKITVTIDIVGAKENEFKTDNKDTVKFYHAYDVNNKRYKINEKIYKGLISGNLPAGIYLEQDSKLSTPDEGIIAIK